jgi:hypothetical protein
VRLVDDHQVPAGVGQPAQQWIAASGGERRDGDRPVHNNLAGRCRPGLGDRGRQPELPLEFVAPLVDKSRRNDHQHLVGEPAHA